VSIIVARRSSLILRRPLLIFLKPRGSIGSRRFFHLENYLDVQVVRLVLSTPLFAKARVRTSVPEVVLAKQGIVGDMLVLVRLSPEVKAPSLTFI
jgi:hypothetical protein